MRFDFKVVIVTGAASGIGLATARQFSSEGRGMTGKPEDIAAAITFLASDEAQFIRGDSVIVDGGRLGKL